MTRTKAISLGTAAAVISALLFAAPAANAAIDSSAASTADGAAPPSMVDGRSSTDADCLEDRFCLDAPLKRWAVAVWLSRLIYGDDAAPVSTSRFVDVDAEQDWWAGHVERLADLGVVTACSVDPPRFCPDRLVSRSEMAALLGRASDKAHSESATGHR